MNGAAFGTGLKHKVTESGSCLNTNDPSAITTVISNSYGMKLLNKAGLSFVNSIFYFSI